jgi:hypothetical protein
METSILAGTSLVGSFPPLGQQQDEKRNFVTLNECERTESERTDDSLAFSNATSGATSDDGDLQHQEVTTREPLPYGATQIAQEDATISRNEMKRSPSQEEQHYKQRSYDPYRYAQSGGSESIDLLDHLVDDGTMFPDDSAGTMSGVESSYDSKRHNHYELDSLLDTPPSSLQKHNAGAEGVTMNPPLSTTTMSVNIFQPNMNGHHNNNALPSCSMTPSSASSGGQTPPTHLLGSISSTGSQKPVLYSAIGSLEDASNNSFGQIRNQFKAMSNRGFARPAGKLLPPAIKGKSKNSNKQSNSNNHTNVVHVAHTRFSIDPSVEISPTVGGEEKKQERTPSTVSHRKSATPKGTGSMTQLNNTVESSGSRRKAAGTVAGVSATTAMKDAKSKKLRRKPEKVTIDPTGKISKKKAPEEMFRPSSDAYTPRVQKKNIKYKPAEMRTPVQSRNQNMGTLSKPNFRDALRRVAMIVKQHIVKIEQRFEGGGGGGTTDGLFRASMMETFAEDTYVSPKYKCTMVRLPMARPGMVYGLRKIQEHFKIPTEEEIYDFGHRLFDSVQLSSECSIVCLIYMERLMEVAKVPLVARTWRPIFMCGLLLASKVWQDLSSWNIEFASVYPQFSLDAINRLEIQFLKSIKWDLYISSSLYAKYYFALRSLLAKQDFRVRYNRMVGGVGSVNASEALKVQQRSEQVKEEALLNLSRSM